MSVHQIYAVLNRRRVGIALLGFSGIASAHPRAGDGTDFMTGVLHPLTGIDHLLAMMAVGMWGAQLGGNAIWVLPVAFPLVMAFGAVAGILAFPMFAIEPGIAASVIALGTVIALNFRPPLAAAALLISVFAIFHGYAHGAELPNRADALPYCIGFVMATGLVHLAGISIGLITNIPRGLAVLRLLGTGIALGGIVFAVRLLSH